MAIDTSTVTRGPTGQYRDLAQSPSYSYLGGVSTIVDTIIDSEIYGTAATEVFLGAIDVTGTSVVSVTATQDHLATVSETGASTVAVTATQDHKATISETVTSVITTVGETSALEIFLGDLAVAGTSTINTTAIQEAYLSASVTGIGQIELAGLDREIFVTLSVTGEGIIEVTPDYDTSLELPWNMRDFRPVDRRAIAGLLINPSRPPLV